MVGFIYLFITLIGLTLRLMYNSWNIKENNCMNTKIHMSKEKKTAMTKWHFWQGLSMAYEAILPIVVYIGFCLLLPNNKFAQSLVQTGLMAFCFYPILRLWYDTGLNIARGDVKFYHRGGEKTNRGMVIAIMKYIENWKFLKFMTKSSWYQKILDDPFLKYPISFWLLRLAISVGLFAGYFVMYHSNGLMP